MEINVENIISEPLDFKISGGGAPRPPYKLAPLALVLKPPQLNIGFAVPKTILMTSKDLSFEMFKIRTQDKISNST